MMIYAIDEFYNMNTMCVYVCVTIEKYSGRDVTVLSFYRAITYDSRIDVFQTVLRAFFRVDRLERSSGFFFVLPIEPPGNENR